MEDGINAVRLVLNRCWFDQEKCVRGVEALKQYRCAWDEGRKVFRDAPLHDWTSHGADALRYLFTGLRKGGQGAVERSDYEFCGGLVAVRGRRVSTAFRPDASFRAF